MAKASRHARGGRRGLWSTRRTLWERYISPGHRLPSERGRVARIGPEVHRSGGVRGDATHGTILHRTDARSEPCLPPLRTEGVTEARASGMAQLPAIRVSG